MYEATFKDKDAAWFVYKRLKDTARANNEPVDAKINGSTIECSNIRASQLEEIADKIQAKYKASLN